MGEVVTYRNEPGRLAFCQLKLTSGERVVISVVDSEVRIVAQRGGGRLPAAPLWSSRDVARLMALFGDPLNPGKHPLEAMRDRILDIASVEALERFLAST
ncbi:MAG TPA: hypothetical protein VMQ51_07170 [Candidatus Binatia bacterium]|nr:hypothetical protein [Candidatus Binatia bacterium]